MPAAPASDVQCRPREEPGLVEDQRNDNQRNECQCGVPHDAPYGSDIVPPDDTSGEGKPRAGERRPSDSEPAGLPNNQAKPSQAKPSQAKPSQAKPRVTTKIKNASMNCTFRRCTEYRSRRFPVPSGGSRHVYAQKLVCRTASALRRPAASAEAAASAAAVPSMSARPPTW